MPVVFTWHKINTTTYNECSPLRRNTRNIIALAA